MDELKDEDVPPMGEPSAAEYQLQSARYAMHRVRFMHYQTMVKNGVMQPDIAKQFYLAAMQNYDDTLKGSANGCFAEAIEREMAAFDINKAFA